ncbi:hypothetical protein M8C21_013898, partial [Ambrosia artemisiifolia]
QFQVGTTNTNCRHDKSAVHRDGDYHRAVHIWIFAESTQQLLLQKRTDWKDSWPGLWDISSAGHVSAGDTSLITARRELQEELGITLPNDAFELLYVYLQESVTNDGKFIDNELDDVYLVTTLDPIPLEAFTLQESEVSAVKYISIEDYKHLLAKGDPHHLTGITEEDKEVLVLLIQAARIMDDIFYQQVWNSNPSLREWLNGRAQSSELDMLKWKSCLDENEAFLTTADSAVKLLSEATKPVANWKGLEYKAAFPILKPSGANFYPPDMDKMEFESWIESLSENEKQDATGFFNATFEAFIGIRDDKATAQVKLFGDHLQLLEQNLPMDDIYKSPDVIAAPIRVIQLVYNSGDVKGPQTVAFNLPNDERIVKDRGTSMVMLKNVSEAKSYKNFTRLLKKLKLTLLAFGPLIFLLLSKGQALQFNWLFEKGAFVLHSDQTFSVDFDKIEGAVESLSREILTIQAKGDKDAAQMLLEKYGKMTQPLNVALENLAKVQVPVDITPDFPIVTDLLHKN